MGTAILLFLDLFGSLGCAFKVPKARRTHCWRDLESKNTFLCETSHNSSLSLSLSLSLSFSLHTQTPTECVCVCVCSFLGPTNMLDSFSFPLKTTKKRGHQPKKYRTCQSTHGPVPAHAAVGHLLLCVQIRRAEVLQSPCFGIVGRVVESSDRGSLGRWDPGRVWRLPVTVGEGHVFCYFFLSKDLAAAGEGPAWLESM